MNEETLKDAVENLLADVMHAQSHAKATGESPDVLLSADGLNEIASIVGYEVSGMITQDQGMIVRFAGGAEYDVIVRQRR